MDVRGEYPFDAPLERVWEVLLDPDALARCMPGCEQLSPLGEGHYEATMSLGLGSIKGTYRAKITVADQVLLRSYKLIVDGNGAAGFVRGEALVSLAGQNGKTVVTVEGQAQVGGTIARVGQRLIGSVNKMMMDRFFNCLRESASLPGSEPQSNG